MTETLGADASIVTHRRFESHNAEQVREMLAGLYGDNRFAFIGNDQRARVTIYRRDIAGISLVRAAFSGGFRIDLEGMVAAERGLAIFLRSSGAAQVRTRDGTVVCPSGRWVPFGSNDTREVHSSHALSDTAIIISPQIVAAACATYCGSAVGEPLQLAASPFGAALAARWGECISALDGLMAMRACPPAAVTALAHHALALMLKGHDHNFSRYLSAAARVPAVARPDDAFGLAGSEYSPAGHGDSNLTQEQIIRLRAYIESALDGRLDVPVLAQVAGMRTTRFTAAFHRTFGMTPARYVRQERLRRALWLLEHDKMSIAAIAAEAGFASQSHLTSRMLIDVGLTPLGYRKALRAH